MCRVSRSNEPALGHLFSSLAATRGSVRLPRSLYNRSPACPQPQKGTRVSPCPDAPVQPASPQPLFRSREFDLTARVEVPDHQLCRNVPGRKNYKDLSKDLSLPPYALPARLLNTSTLVRIVAGERAATPAVALAVARALDDWSAHCGQLARAIRQAQQREGK